MYIFHKNIRQHKCFQQEMIHEHRIRMFSEWFQKDHVTLKTRVMAAENLALPSKE